MMTRKEFLALLAAGMAAPSANPNPPTSASPLVQLPPITLPPVQPGPAYLLAGPMLGHVGDREARLWVRAAKPAKWAVRIAETADLAKAREFAGPALEEATATTGILVLQDLRPSTRYFYDVLLNGRSQLTRPHPSFTTAPAPGTAGRQRIVFGSCVGQPAHSASSWAELAARREISSAGGFDLLLMLGDNHYANSVDPEKLRLYLTAHRLSPGWRDFTARAPVYAIWDDHDYGKNDSDGTLAGKADSLRIFHEFWPNPLCEAAQDDGIYFTFTRGDVQFFMLDGRYQRSPNPMPDGPDTRNTVPGAGL